MDKFTSLQSLFPQVFRGRSIELISTLLLVPQSRMCRDLPLYTSTADNFPFLRNVEVNTKEANTEFYEYVQFGQKSNKISLHFLLWATMNSTVPATEVV
jgi:hypothetical protein